MVKGITAYYLLHRVYAVGQGDILLVHAAAGGVGQILCQWAKHLWATVLGTVGSSGIVQISQSSCVDHVNLPNQCAIDANLTTIIAVKEVTISCELCGQYN